MIIHLASDHAGFEIKNELLGFIVNELGFDVEDHGAYQYNEEDDFPDFIKPAAEAVSQNPEEDRAIILGGSGQGEAMAANRYKGVRAAVFYGGPIEIITLTREHNNANVLSLGARFLNTEEVKEVVRIWLDTSFSSNDKYLRRNEKLDI